MTIYESVYLEQLSELLQVNSLKPASSGAIQHLKVELTHISLFGTQIFQSGILFPVWSTAQLPLPLQVKFGSPFSLQQVNPFEHLDWPGSQVFQSGIFKLLEHSPVLM
jgi:hypothetical protein